MVVVTACLRLGFMFFSIKSSFMACSLVDWNKCMLISSI